jgi:hypothetical protein
MTPYAFLVRHTPCCAGTFLSFIDGPGIWLGGSRRQLPEPGALRNMGVLTGQEGRDIGGGFSDDRSGK